MDERLGRRVAGAMGITVTGRVASWWRPSVQVAVLKPVLDSLVRTGFRIGPETRSALLHLAGEDP